MIIIISLQLLQGFLPGQIVSGTLNFTLEDAKSYQSIEIGLQGGAHVRWTEAATLTMSRGSANATSTMNKMVPFDSKETYVEQGLIVWTSEESSSGTIGPGNFSFDFQFTIPMSCLGSFEGSYGSIRYIVYGQLKTGKQLGPDHRTEIQIPVARPTDVNLTQFMAPVRQTKRKNVKFLCCGGDIELTVSLSRTGFCIGRNVPVSVNVVNGSSRQIKIQTSIKKQCRYYAQGHTRCETNVLTSIVSPGISSHSQQSWTADELILPEVVEVSFEGSTIIQLQYVVEVTAVVPWANNISMLIPITLGNVPFDK